jgi:hypothetical protein
MSTNPALRGSKKSNEILRASPSEIEMRYAAAPPRHDHDSNESIAVAADMISWMHGWCARR